MSKEPDKKRGLFGRLFGAKDTTPGTPQAAPDVDLAASSALSPAEVPNADTSARPQADAAGGDEPSDGGPADARAETMASITPDASPQAAGAPRLGWLQRLRSGLAKSSAKLADGISSVFTKRKLDNETLDDLEDLLIQADLGLETAERVTASLRKTRFDKSIAPEEVRQVLAAEVEKVLAPVAVPLTLAGTHTPEVILFVGVNGTGKTTTIGKLAARFRAQGLSVLLAAGDTFRAAAIEQLKVWGERTGAPVVSGEVGADAAGLAYEALAQAKRDGVDVLLVDTAGRLQNKKGLMEELEKVVRVLKKLDPSAPHQVLLVLDATTGQNALSQVEVFQQVAGVTGLIMTKLDGTARGGILVAISARFGLPVVALGVGERVEDLQSFDAGEFSRVLAQV